MRGSWQPDVRGPKLLAPFGIVYSPMSSPVFKYGIFNDIAAIKELVTHKTCGVISEPIQVCGVPVASDNFLMEFAQRYREVD